jgi:hypothetical protein
LPRTLCTLRLSSPATRQYPIRGGKESKKENLREKVSVRRCILYGSAVPRTQGCKLLGKCLSCLNPISQIVSYPPPQGKSLFLHTRLPFPRNEDPPVLSSPLRVSRPRRENMSNPVKWRPVRSSYKAQHSATVIGEAPPRPLHGVISPVLPPNRMNRMNRRENKINKNRKEKKKRRSTSATNPNSPQE